MKHEEIEINNYLKNGSRLLGYEFNGNSIIDLYNFTMSSLKDACENFKISKDKSKQEFDHQKINNCNDFYKHQEKISEYLKMDVISMKELYRILHIGGSLWRTMGSPSP